MDSGNRNRTKRIALLGLLIALAMVLSYVESLVPAFFAVPGMKLGLTNVVVLAALYNLDEKSALGINLIRILLVGMLFGTGVSLVYSLAGGVLSTLVMILLKRTGRFRLGTVSVAGGICHNIGQILAACFLLGTGAIAWYLAALWLSGIGAGAVVGLLAGLVTARTKGLWK